jgi:hypothetical protein
MTATANLMVELGKLDGSGRSGLFVGGFENGMTGWYQ